MTTRFFGNSKYQWKHTAQAVYEDRQSEYYNEPVNKGLFRADALFNIFINAQGTCAKE